MDTFDGEIRHEREIEIEWTDATWNPVRGCTKISPGCTHCYAETFAERFRGVPGILMNRDSIFGLSPEKLVEPIDVGEPPDGLRQLDERLCSTRMFPTTTSMLVARVMATANWHTYQVLTKRSERLRDLLRSKLAFRGRIAAHLVGRQRRESQARPSTHRPPPQASPRWRSCLIEPLLKISANSIWRGSIG